MNISENIKCGADEEFSWKGHVIEKLNCVKSCKNVHMPLLYFTLLTVSATFNLDKLNGSAPDTIKTKVEYKDVRVQLFRFHYILLTRRKTAII